MRALAALLATLVATLAILGGWWSGAKDEALLADSAPIEPFGSSWIIVENQPCQMYLLDPSPKPVESVTWSGACVDGKTSGRGRAIWRLPDGEVVYEGEHRAGKAHGHGVVTWSDGDRFEGTFRDGKWHGHGVVTLSNGTRIEGEFRDGKWSGAKDEALLADSAPIEPFGSDWFIVENQPCQMYRHSPKPVVMVTWSGACVDGKTSGRGRAIWILLDGEEMYVGEHRAGKRHGHGVHISSDGTHYEGEFRDGKVHGHGVVTLSDGIRFEGEFRDGVPHGHGVVTSSDGTRFEGEFRDGKVHGHGAETLE